MRVLGIDCGTECTGWGVIESDGVRLVYVASGVITPPKDDDLAYRLSALFDAVTSVIQSFSPSEAAVAETFAEEGVDEVAAMEQVAERKLRTMARLDGPTQRRRLYSFLARRGYDLDAIQEVIRRLTKAVV